MTMTMSIGRRATTICVQLLGNIFKGIFYLDIFLRPGKRYSIPAFAPARTRALDSKAIPRIVWLTNYTSQVTLSIYVNYLFNRWMAPTFEFRFCCDDDCDHFIKEHFSAEIYDCYSRLQIGAAKADLWRILVLLVRGGVYMDIDAGLTWSPEAFLSKEQTELFVRPKDGKLTNYFLASAPSNPIFKAIADRIIENISTDSITSVFDMTGPTVVDMVSSGMPVCVEPYDIVCKQGLFTKKAFQYPGNKKHYWAEAQRETDIVKKQTSEAYSTGLE